MVLLASEYPFKRVVGIELSTSLHGRAAANLQVPPVVIPVKASAPVLVTDAPSNASLGGRVGRWRGPGFE